MSRLSRLFEKFRPAPAREPEKRSDVRWVIVGLGNPGEKYRRSRHNLGFMVVERIAEARGTGVAQSKFKGLFGAARLKTESGAADAIVLKPQTFYNLSGESVAPLLGYFRVPPERLIVVHDELDLESGRLRIKIGGGDAGNRGVRSITAALGINEFIRVRVGIGHPETAQDTRDYILEREDALRRRERERPQVRQAAE